MLDGYLNSKKPCWAGNACVVGSLTGSLCESKGTCSISRAAPRVPACPGIYARAGRSVSGVSKGEPPASSRVGLRPLAPHQVAPLLKRPPPRASPFTNCTASLLTTNLPFQHAPPNPLSKASSTPTPHQERRPRGSISGTNPRSNVNRLRCQSRLARRLRGVPALRGRQGDRTLQALRGHRCLARWRAPARRASSRAAKFRLKLALALVIS
jgi:hypothetical protein